MKKAISAILAICMIVIFIQLPVEINAAAENIDYKNALLFDTPPVIDGYISEEEWGEETVFVEMWDCATIDDVDPYFNFFYNRVDPETREGYEDFYCRLWFRWDANKFYIGAKVKDPDTHSLKYGTTDTWNGDALQVRIDKLGPNAVVNGNDFAVTEALQKPWSTESVPDFLFGYSQIAGGFSEAWENTANKGMTSFSRNPYGVADCIVAPAGSDYSEDTRAGITTYEIGIPWAYIFNGEYESLLMISYRPGRGDGPRGAIGRRLGVSLSVLNDGADANGGWDAFMAWGSGICSAHQTVGAHTCTGSNSVTLVADKVAQSEDYRTYDPTSLLDAKFTSDNLDPPGVYYDYLAGDTGRENPISYGELSALTYDDPSHLSVWGSSDYGGRIGNAGGTHKNVLDYRTVDFENVNTYIDTREGENQLLYPTSYTLEFDIMYTGTEQTVEEYPSQLYNWFGGNGGYSYQCGYFFEEGQFRVVNTNDSEEILSSYSYDLKKDTWYNWRFQFNNDTCKVRLFVDDLTTEADNAESERERLGSTGEWGTLVAEANSRYFYYSGERAKEEGTLLLFRMMNTQVAYDNVKIYNYAILREPERLVPAGDVNGDGVVNVYDTNIMKRYLAGMYTDVFLEAADANGDGAVNSEDSNALVRIISGLYTPEY
ncbi:MAG: hypothetical protein IJD22_02435 [Clostridia bacterium]|nr:hypothetical protein [Clostridia bacterium]